MRLLAHRSRIRFWLPPLAMLILGFLHPSHLESSDIFIGENTRDGMMDDLDGNGKIDSRDAEVLYRLFEGQENRPSYEPLVGGMWLYGSTDNHAPFVHVDARGFRTRW